MYTVGMETELSSPLSIPHRLPCFHPSTDKPLTLYYNALKRTSLRVGASDCYSMRVVTAIAPGSKTLPGGKHLLRYCLLAQVKGGTRNWTM